MSTEQTGLGGEFIISKQYINLNLEKDDWCSYKGECLINNVLNHKDICYFCQHRLPLDIPAILKKLHKKQNREE